MEYERLDLSQSKQYCHVDESFLRARIISFVIEISRISQPFHVDQSVRLASHLR